MVTSQSLKFDHYQLFNLAIKNLDEQRIFEAYCLLEKVISLNNGFAPAHAYLGWLLAFQFSEFAASEYHLKNAWAQLSDDPELAVDLVMVLRFQEKYDEATQMIKELLAKDFEEKPSLFYELGLIYEHEQNLEAAVETFNKAIASSTEFTNVTLIEEAKHRCTSKMNHR